MTPRKYTKHNSLLEVRSAVVFLAGDVESARDAIISAIQTAAEPEAILHFLSPHIRASADRLASGWGDPLQRNSRKQGYPP